MGHLIQTEGNPLDTAPLMPIGEICEGSLMANSRLSGQKKSHPAGWLLDITCNTYKLAERTGLEPATLGVTGRYSNQLNYRSNTAKSGVPRGIRTPVLTVKG